jgi:hypothetical protein
MKQLIAYLALALLLAGCSSPKLSLGNQTADPNKPTILVAMLKGSQSEAKQELVSLLRRDYGAEYNVIVKEVKNHKDLAGEEFRALVVMERLKAWLWFNGGLKDITRKADKARTVYFVSAGDAKWKWKGSDLKLVTAATQEAKAADTYQELKALLQPVLED